MKTILLIEDDRVFAQKCIEELLIKKFDVKYAENSEKAKNIVLNCKIDIIIIDLMLPPTNELEGLNFYKYLIIEHITIPAIFITTKSFKTTEIVAEAMKLGAKDFLEKDSDLFLDKLTNSIYNEIKSSKSKIMIKHKYLHFYIKNLFIISVSIFLFLFTLYFLKKNELPILIPFIIIVITSLSLIIIFNAFYFREKSLIGEKSLIDILKTPLLKYLPQILKKIIK